MIEFLCRKKAHHGVSYGISNFNTSDNCGFNHNCHCL